MSNHPGIPIQARLSNHDAFACPALTTMQTQMTYIVSPTA